MTIQNDCKRARGVLLVLASFALSACGPRVIVSTGTTIGLKATPGDGSTRPPQVTLAYKRTEFALVPTAKQKAKDNTDAFSTLASIYFATEWFGATQIHSLLGSGIAARDVQDLADAKQADSKKLQDGQKTEQKNGQSTFWDSFSKAAQIPATSGNENPNTKGK